MAIVYGKKLALSLRGSPRTKRGQRDSKNVNTHNLCARHLTGKLLSVLFIIHQARSTKLVLSFKAYADFHC